MVKVFEPDQLNMKTEQLQRTERSKRTTVLRNVVLKRDMFGELGFSIITRLTSSGFGKRSLYRHTLRIRGGPAAEQQRNKLLNEGDQLCAVNGNDVTMLLHEDVVKDSCHRLPMVQSFRYKRLSSYRRICYTTIRNRIPLAFMIFILKLIRSIPGELNLTVN